MNISLPISVIIAVVFLVSSSLDKRIFSKKAAELAVKDTVTALVLPDTTKKAPLADTASVITAVEKGFLGYRVQVFSTENQIKAQTLRNQLKFRFPYEVHIIYEDSLYKVRMGDFTEKASAEKFCAELKTGEYSGAWVVAGPIDLLVDGFRIQLASMKTLTSAATYARLVESELPLVVHLVKAEDGWKIRVGDFIDKIEAEKKKQELQAKGYSGAWVVEDKVKK